MYDESNVSLSADGLDICNSVSTSQKLITDISNCTFAQSELDIMDIIKENSY